MTTSKGIKGNYPTLICASPPTSLWYSGELSHRRCREGSRNQVIPVKVPRPGLLSGGPPSLQLWLSPFLSLSLGPSLFNTLHVLLPLLQDDKIPGDRTKPRLFCEHLVPSVVLVCSITSWGPRDNLSLVTMTGFQKCIKGLLCVNVLNTVDGIP